VSDSIAYKATMDDKSNCENSSCLRTINGAKSNCSGVFGSKLPDPAWINKFAWFQGLAISTGVLGYITLIYGCWLETSGCNKVWPLDLIIQLILGALVGAAGILLLFSILDITGKGTRDFPPTCLSRFTEDSSYVAPPPPPENNNETDVDPKWPPYPEPPEDIPPTEEEIKMMTKFTTVLAAAVLAMVDALCFGICAVLIFVFRPKEPPPQPPQPAQQPQQVLIIQRPSQQQVLFASQPIIMYQPPPPPTSQVYIGQVRSGSVYTQPQPVYY